MTLLGFEIEELFEALLDAYRDYNKLQRICLLYTSDAADED